MFLLRSWKMLPAQAASQMRLAYDLVVKNLSCSWENANAIEKELSAELREYM